MTSHVTVTLVRGGQICAQFGSSAQDRRGLLDLESRALKKAKESGAPTEISEGDRLCLVIPRSGRKEGYIVATESFSDGAEK